MKHSLLAGVVLLTSTYLAGAADKTRVWVQFAAGQKGAVQASLAAAGGEVHHEFEDLRAIAVSVPATALDGLARNPNIELIEPDPQRELFAQSVPYGIDKVQARDVWDADRNNVVDAGAPTGAGITVCVIDSGVQASHEDLSSVAISGESGTPTTWSTDGCAHGTHVVGTIAAANNSVGVVGVSPGTVSIYAVKVFGDNCGWAYSSDLVYAANRCKAAGAKVISMSLGGSGSSGTESSAFQSLYDQGILSIAAAGNSGNTTVSYPAGYASVVSVAAVDINNSLASFSQRNSDVELAAPGVNVLSTVPGGYSSYNGTSMATPHVSGVAALIWSDNLTKTPAQIRAALQQTALDLGTAGRDNSYGYGLVRAKAALDYLRGGGGGGGDTTDPVITNVASQKTNSKNGQFSITWTTNEPSTTEVRFSGGSTYSNASLVTSHKMSFRGTKGATYSYYVASTDAAGNRAESGPFTHQN